MAVIQIGPDQRFDLKAGRGLAWLRVSWDRVGEVMDLADPLAVRFGLLLYAADFEIVAHPGDPARPAWHAIGERGLQDADSQFARWHDDERHATGVGSKETLPAAVARAPASNLTIGVWNRDQLASWRALGENFSQLVARQSRLPNDAVVNDFSNGFIVTGGEAPEQIDLASAAEAAGWDGVFTWMASTSRTTRCGTGSARDEAWRARHHHGGRDLSR